MMRASGVGGKDRGVARCGLGYSVLRWCRCLILLWRKVSFRTEMNCIKLIWLRVRGTDGTSWVETSPSEYHSGFRLVPLDLICHALSRELHRNPLDGNRTLDGFEKSSHQYEWEGMVIVCCIIKNQYIAGGHNENSLSDPGIPFMTNIL